MKTKSKNKLLTLIAVISIVAMILSTLPFVGLTAFAETSGDFEYEILDDGTAEIIDYTGNATNLTIPSEIDGYTVTSLGVAAFASCTSLESVIIPGSVTSIGYMAFFVCLNLESITIPDSVTSIGDMAFYFCQSLESITIPDGVSSIEDGTFMSCKSLESVTIPDSVKVIGSRAFGGCASLESITIPNSVQVLGSSAFQACGLKSVTIPDSVTSIGIAAFSGCTNLVNIDVEDKNTAYSSKDGVLFNKAKTELAAYPAGKTEKSYTIPDSVMSIGQYAFAYCHDLENITIPNSVTSIGSYAFAGCDFESIIIPDSVTSMDVRVFWESALTTIYGYSGSYAETYANEHEYYTFIPIQDFTDADSGISIVVTNADTLPENVELNVETVENTDSKAVYDITLVVDGKEIQPNGEVTVKIPVPETMDGESVKVYREEADGSLTDMNAIFQNGYMVFTTDHFSRYILDGTVAENPDDDVQNPDDDTQTPGETPSNPDNTQQDTDKNNQQDTDNKTPENNSQQSAGGNANAEEIPNTNNELSNSTAIYALVLTLITVISAFGVVIIRRKKYLVK